MLISAVVSAKPTTTHLESVLDSLHGFHEVIICDLGAPSKMIEMARSRGCRIHDASDLGESKSNTALNHAVKEATRRWVLLLDDDELVTPELVAHINEFVSSSGSLQGLYIPRKNYLLNRWRKITYPDYQLRLFKRDSSFFPDVPGKSEVQISGDAGKIVATETEKALVHLSPTVSSLVEMLNYDTTRAACKEKHPHVSGFDLIVKPAQTFFKHYLLKGCCRYGKAGLVHSQNCACNTYVRLAKMLEQQLHDEIVGN